MTIEAIGMMMIEITSSRLLQGLGFSNGWAELGPKIAAAVGAELLDGDLGGHGADGDRLACPARACSPGRRLRSVIGTPVATSRIATSTDRGTSTKTRARGACPGRNRPARAAPRRPRITASITASPHAGRDELEPDDRAKLAEIRKMLLARIMLEVGVGHERADRVEDHGRVGPGVVDPRRVFVAERGERALAVGVQERQMALQEQDRERDHEEGGVEGQHRECVLLPAHPGRLAVAEQLEQCKRAWRRSPCRRARRAGSRTRAIHQPSGIEPAIGSPIAQNGCNKREIQ